MNPWTRWRLIFQYGTLFAITFAILGCIALVTIKIWVEYGGWFLLAPPVFLLIIWFSAWVVPSWIEKWREKERTWKEPKNDNPA